MASAVCGVTAGPHLPSAVPAAARKLFFRCRAASTMNEASASSPDAEEKKTTTVFVAGSTGRTGKRVVEKLLAIVAGTTDVNRARGSLPQDPNLQLRGLVRSASRSGPHRPDTPTSPLLGRSYADWAAFFLPPGPAYQVDNFDTVNLVEACRKAGVTRFVLISSILVNGAAMGQLLNPAYILLNLLGLTLVAKLQAENHIRKSGINYTIVWPGGLTDQPPTGNIVMEPEDTLYSGSISRSQVAEVAVEALLCPESSYKVVEIIARADAPNRPLKDTYAAIKQN
ncbi:unnamed protein product [Miscanthus lutarioriparius]|uniref:NAD(P)-binding domain-containing protein n=1 Tax=Miscanthus lutarioriparius TaxID=422564 RepID=A0A811QAI8_9POAL|nr:unnamed protein product [Miscanthus lutarioriparius]